MIWPGQSGIDARVKSVSPQSVACPVTHTHTRAWHHCHTTKLFANCHPRSPVRRSICFRQVNWSESWVVIELILAAGFIQGTHWQGLTQCFDLDSFRQVIWKFTSGQKSCWLACDIKVTKVPWGILKDAGHNFIEILCLKRLLHFSSDNFVKRVQHRERVLQHHPPGIWINAWRIQVNIKCIGFSIIQYFLLFPSML